VKDSSNIYKYTY